MRTRPNSPLIRFAIPALLVAACAAGFAAAQPKAVDKTVLAGFEKSIDAGLTTEVEPELFRYVVANPKDARGFYLLAKLRLRQERQAEAKSLLAKALSLDAGLLDAKLALARVAFRLGEPDEARSIVAGLAETDLTDDARRLSAAETAEFVGDCPRALAFAEKLRPAAKNGRALPLRASCYLAAGDRKNFAALQPLAKAQARTNADVAVAFGEVLFKAGLAKETSELLRLVVASAPRNYGALVLLARSEIALRDFGGARTHLAQAEKLQPEAADLPFVKATLESEQGNYAAALELLQKSLAARPDDPEVLARFVVVALRASRKGDAMRAAEKLIALAPANLDYLYLVGVAALQSNNLDRAEDALTRFLAARPSDSLGCLALGLTFAAQPTRIGEARAQLERCLVSNPDNFEASYQLGLSYKVQGETERAIAYFERTVKSSPNYAAALRDLGTAYLQSGAETRARPVLEKAAALDPNDAEVHFQLSRLYNLIGETELARRQLELFQKLKNPKKDGM